MINQVLPDEKTALVLTIVNAAGKDISYKDAAKQMDLLFKDKGVGE